VGLGQGPNVVLDLVRKAELGPGSKIYFDNLFTSFPLLQELSGERFISLFLHFYCTVVTIVHIQSKYSTVSTVYKFLDMGMSGTGTMRQNRLNKIPINTKKEMEKKAVERGTLHTIYKDDQVLYFSVQYCS
jgi:hypothetical protein